MNSALIFGVLSTYVIVSGAPTVNPILHDGPCPSTAPAANFDANQLDGRWLDTFTTYEAINPSNQRRCVQNFIQIDGQDGEFYLNSTFKEANESDSAILRKKFVPVVGHPGKYTAQIPDNAGGWKNHGWEYTFVAFSGDSFLEFGCKQEGTQHKEFHRIRSRNVPLPQSVIDDLTNVARAAGDNRPMFQYDHANCNYD